MGADTRKIRRVKDKGRYMNEHNIIELKPVVAIKELQGKITGQNKNNKTRIAVLIAAVIIVIVGTYFILTHQTYSNIKVTSTIADKGATENQYQKFAEGYLKYGRDGVSLVNGNGDESWNQPYQMQNPIVEISGNSVAIADRGGNSIVVLNKEGLKGEMETLLPIEKISVSDEGVVAVLMKNENAPEVTCYDATGNVLVEHKATVSATGYPMDVAISKDGLTMMVSYLYTNGNGYSGKIIYYNFGEEGKSQADNVISEQEIERTIVPSVYFVDKKTSVAVGDSSFVVNGNTGDKDAYKTYQLDKSIVSTFYTNRYIGFILQNSGSEGYELRVYNLKGKTVMSKKIKRRYSNIKMVGQQILMYEGDCMCIYSLNGVKHFEGNVDNTIINIFPTFGINKYRLMSADGIKTIRLVR